MIDNRVALAVFVWAILCAVYVPFYIFCVWRIGGGRGMLYFGTASLMISSLLFNVWMYTS